MNANDPSSKKRPFAQDRSTLATGSPPRKVARLATVRLPLSETEHQTLDHLVLSDDWLDFLPKHLPLPAQHAPYLLTVIVDRAADLLDRNFAVRTEAEKLVNGNDDLLEELKEAWNDRSFSRIRCLVILQRNPRSRGAIPSSVTLAVPREEQVQASAKSWQTPYQQGSADVFLKTINKRFADPNITEMYANHVAVVQSSGTGKSRMLHEVSGKVFGVIFNFAKDSAGAFPKPDRQVRDFLITSHSQNEVQARATCFFIALFGQLCKMRPNDPSKLRAFLGYGDPQKDEQRMEFFDDIINQARMMSPTSSTPMQNSNTSPSAPPRFRSEKGMPKSLDDAAKELSESVLDKLATTSQIKLVLGFDEASEMTIEEATAQSDAFTEIRRILRSIRDRPIYSAFMSTTGSTRQFHPRPENDKSTRLQFGLLRLWAPYTLVGYDQLATPLSVGCTLDDVTKMNYMLGLGRPLWKTRYINGTKAIKDGIVQFAKEKLLNGPDSDNMAQKIAPLAVRLPLAFNTLTDKGRAAECGQIEAHMRICLNIVPEAEAMYSVAPSEPILNEAAAQIMGGREKRSRGHSVHVLQQFLSDRYLSKGDRGELACMLLLLYARDRTCNPPGGLPGSRDPMPYHRPIRVTDFLTNLFAERHGATILGSQGAMDGTTLQTTFGDSWMHFTHFIKVTDFKVVNRSFLMRAMARGAAILCADNQLGVDFILPKCVKGPELTLNNISAILGQIKNLPFLNKPQNSILAKMDPRKVGIFEKEFKGHPPVIKLVLSVGTEKPGFRCQQLPQKRSSRRGNASSHAPQFEIFAAGLSDETFGPIHKSDESIWRELVSRSGVEDIYGAEDGVDVLPIVRRMTPCAQADGDHWSAFFPLAPAAFTENDADGSSDSEGE